MKDVTTTEDRDLLPPATAEQLSKLFEACFRKCPDDAFEADYGYLFE